jgi:hypothetical protein
MANMTHFSFDMPEDDYRALKLLAAFNAMHEGAFLRTLIHDAIRRDEKKIKFAVSSLERSKLQADKNFADQLSRMSREAKNG